MEKRPYFYLSLFVLASFRYSHEFESSSLNWDGPLAGTGVICIILIVLCFKILRAIQEYLLKAKLLNRPITSRYDIFIPFTLIIGAIGYQNHGPFIEKNGEKVLKWSYMHGSLNESYTYFFLSVIGLVFLIKVFHIVKNLQPHTNN